jgi:hypothetical protein
MVPEVVQQAQGKPIMTQWGWQNSPAWNEAAKVIGNAGHKSTIMDLGQKIPTAAEARKMIEATGGKVLRIEEHEPGGVSTHTFPHVNYETQSGNSATVRIQSLN